MPSFGDQPFSEDEKTRIYMHLGYGQWQSNTSQAIQLGVPTAIQSWFLVQQAIDRIAVASRPYIREALQELDCIDRERSAARKRFAATKVETITLNKDEIMRLDTEQKYWAGRLADLLGVDVARPSNRYTLGFGSNGVSGTVIG